MELVDIYNEDMLKTNIVKDREEELLQGEYHLSIHLWIISNKRILIQKRSINEKVCPNIWSIVTGGAVSGETAEQACTRECFEEIGVKITNKRIIGNMKRQYDFVNIYLTNQMPNIEEIIIDQKEVQEFKIVNINTFEQMIQDGEIIESIIEEYYKYIKPIVIGE